MRLGDIRAENYGVFTQQRFPFGEQGFVLVHGPNEAGKSTLLQLIRELLFGFPHNSNYNFNGGGAMAASVEAVMKDGARLSYRRRKGRTKVVEGTLQPGGESVDEPKLHTLLSHASLPLYEHIFAFSLTELSAGNESIKSAGLTDSLFGGGLGGLAKWQRIKSSLRTDHEELFKPAARNPLINQLITRVRDTKRQQQAAIVKPRDYVEQRERFGQRRGEIAQLQEQRQQKSAALAHYDRLLKAWEHWKTIDQVDGELAACHIPAGFRPGDAETFAHVASQWAAIHEAHEARKQELANVKIEQQQLQQRPELLACLAEIKSLEQELGKIIGFLDDLPAREAEHKASVDKMSAALQSLHREWTIEQLASLRLSADQQARVREQIREHGELSSALEETRREVAQLTSLVERQTQRLATLESDTDAERVNEVLAEQAEYASRRTAIRQAKQTEQRLAAEMQEVSARLSALVTDARTPLAAITPPLDAAVAEFRDRLDAAAKQDATMADQLAAAEAERDRIEQEMAQLDAGGRIPDIEELLAERQRRDAAWRLIRKKYVQSEACDGEIAQWLGKETSPLPDAFAASIARTDELADDRQRFADSVARKDELLRQQRKLDKRFADLEAKCQAATAARDEVLSQWQALWKSTGLTPQSPGVMLDWLRLLSVYREKLFDLEQSQDQRAQDETVCQHFEEQLRAATDDQATPIERLIHTAKLRIDAARRTEVKHEEITVELVANEKQLTEQRAQLAQLEARQTAWQTSWRDLLTKLSLPVDWHIEAIDTLVVVLEQVLSEERMAVSLAERIEQMQSQLKAFEQTSQALAQKAAPDLVGLPMLERVRQLAQQVEAAQAAHSRSATLAQEAERLIREIKAHEQKLTELATERDRLLAAAGVKTPEELRTLAELAQRRDRLLEERRAAERAFGVARENEETEAFQQELKSIDRHQLEQQRADLAKEVADLGEEIGSLQVSSGEMQKELKLLAEEGDVLSLQQTLESQRGELCEAAQRWASIVLAEKLLERAIEDFQREHQPAVLEEARRLFTRMTHGKYVDIRSAAGDSFWVVDHLDNEKRPDQLSRGAREQLYLAFRLAYVQHYCLSAEPLPVVMDDVLVNFDQERALRTFETLFELSEKVQIIFLTCHTPTVELVLRHRPSCATIELGSPVVLSSV